MSKIDVKTKFFIVLAILAGTVMMYMTASNKQDIEISDKGQAQRQNVATKTPEKTEPFIEIETDLEIKSPKLSESDSLSAATGQQPTAVSFENFKFTEESFFAHVKLIPTFNTYGFEGYEVVLTSEEFNLEDFGFTKGDKITHIENEILSDSSDSFSKLITPYLEYDTVFLTINRHNEIQDLEVELK